MFNFKISKRDRFGIYLKLENTSLEITCLIIEAALQSKTDKLPTLNTARTKIEVLKRLIRMIHELNIIPANKYLELETDLQTISRMTNGWIKYLTAA